MEFDVRRESFFKWLTSAILWPVQRLCYSLQNKTKQNNLYYRLVNTFVPGPVLEEYNKLQSQKGGRALQEQLLFSFFVLHLR